MRVRVVGEALPDRAAARARGGLSPRPAVAAGAAIGNEWKPEFKAEGISRCVYEIEPTGASAKLTLTHSMERPGSKFIEAVAEGWPMVISNLKSLLETGEVALVFHREPGGVNP